MFIRDRIPVLDVIQGGEQVLQTLRGDLGAIEIERDARGRLLVADFRVS